MQQFKDNNLPFDDMLSLLLKWKISSKNERRNTFNVKLKVSSLLYSKSINKSLKGTKEPGKEF
jgi:hypothetical protein